jgi:hypothetical protein
MVLVSFGFIALQITAEKLAQCAVKLGWHGCTDGFVCVDHETPESPSPKPERKEMPAGETQTRRVVIRSIDEWNTWMTRERSGLCRINSVEVVQQRGRLYSIVVSEPVTENQLAL